jgi:hypothetical protein
MLLDRSYAVWRSSTGCLEITAKINEKKLEMMSERDQSGEMLVLPALLSYQNMFQPQPND